jgi:hypothetical protein
MTSGHDLLARLSRENYQPWKVPGPHDAAIAAELAGVDSTGSFETLASSIDLAVGRVLNSFAFRMATFALRRQDPAWIRYGLIAAQLAMMVDDDRSVLPSFALLYRSAELIGVDATSVFREMSFLAEHPMRETPRQFADRAPADKAIEAMGLMLVNEPSGPAFRPKGGGEPPVTVG